MPVSMPGASTSDAFSILWDESFVARGDVGPSDLVDTDAGATRPACSTFVCASSCDLLVSNSDAKGSPCPPLSRRPSYRTPSQRPRHRQRPALHRHRARANTLAPAEYCARVDDRCLRIAVRIEQTFRVISPAIRELQTLHRSPKIAASQNVSRRPMCRRPGRRLFCAKPDNFYHALGGLPEGL